MEVREVALRYGSGALAVLFSVVLRLGQDVGHDSEEVVEQHADLCLWN